MTERDPSLRKAAILVASLERHLADALLAQMSPEHTARVRQAVHELGDIDPGEQSSVIEEFFRIGPLVPDKDHSGLNLDLDSTATKHVPATSNLALEETDHQPISCRPETALARLLDEADSATLIPFLLREHPQTVAVVVSQLPPDRAAEVLADLPDSLQGDLARRLVDLNETNPEVLSDVERGLETWLCEVRNDQRRAAGLATLKNILGAASTQTKDAILANVARHDRHLAAKLKDSPGERLSFADVASMETEALKTVIHHADAQLVVLALAGAAPTLVDRIMTQLPLGEANALHYALEHLGPKRRGEIEQAQDDLAAVAERLVGQGRVARPSRRLSLAV